MFFLPALLLTLCTTATTAAEPAKGAANPVPGSTTTQDASAAEATYVLPGSLRKDTSLDQLRRRFGAEHVKVTDIDGAEGETSRGIVLFADDPARRAEIFPADAEKMRGIASIRVSGKSSRWRLDNGLHLGMTLAELVAANGKVVTFSGLDWDYGGGIMDWHEGRLAPRTNDPVFRSVVLSHDDMADGIPFGDAEFRSDDPRYPKQGKVVFVGQLTVSFVEPDGS